MVIRLIFMVLLCPLFLFSGEFTASVSRNQIHVGETFTLTLTLKDASAQGAPALDSLKGSFSIHSQQQIFSSVMVNGRVTASTIWKVAIIPQREGEEVIPSVSIHTSDGILSTEPLTIRVEAKASGGSSESSKVDDVILSTDVSNATPYKNEPFLYTVRIISKKDLADINVQKLTLENAIVEINGEPKIYKKMTDGVIMGIIEFDYLITPLKGGPLKIPSIAIQGVIPIRKKNYGRFFDDDFDSFSMLQGFDRLQPFSLATEEVVLDVLPAIAGMNPWLPAKSLQIEEIWNDSQSLKAGEPFTRGFKIVAEGIKSSQLPSVNDLQKSNPLFKIYADKPEVGDEAKEGSIKSYRKEQYTLIPQQSGTLTLPEISIVWWDVARKEKAVARIQARTLHVLPGSENALTQKIVTEVVATGSESHAVGNPKNLLLYALIAGLTLLLFGVLFWAIILQRKTRRFKEALADLKTVDKRDTYEPQVHVKGKKEKLPDLNPT